MGSKTSMPGAVQNTAKAATGGTPQTPSTLSWGSGPLGQFTNTVKDAMTPFITGQPNASPSAPYTVNAPPQAQFGLDTAQSASGGTLPAFNGSTGYSPSAPPQAQFGLDTAAAHNTVPTAQAGMTTPGGSGYRPDQMEAPRFNTNGAPTQLPPQAAQQAQQQYGLNSAWNNAQNGVNGGLPPAYPTQSQFGRDTATQNRARHNQWNMLRSR